MLCSLLIDRNDVLSALNEGSAIVLLMLDLSAAFDTIDHQILLSRLHDMYGIRGDAHKWFNSYLSDITQRVNISGVLSDSKKLTFGVPQGSVLGPTLYCMYTKPVSDITRRFNLSYHSYADDTQLYVTIKKNRERDVIGNMEKCVA